MYPVLGAVVRLYVVRRDTYRRLGHESRGQQIQ